MRIRKILLVHPSRSTRGLIKKYIFSELNDTEIQDAPSGQDGLAALNSDSFDVIVASDQLKDISVTEFGSAVASTTPNSHSPLIIISESESRQVRNELVEQGFDRVVQIRVRPADLIHKINAVCDPRAWRQDARYHIPSVDVTIRTLEDTIEATLINISMGGLFVELVTRQPDHLMKSGFDITMHIPLTDHPITISGLKSKLLRLEVVNWTQDLIPDTMRATFVFTGMEKGPRNQLAELIQMAGQDKFFATPVNDET